MTDPSRQPEDSACQAAPYQPTYLPWLDEGVDPGEPHSTRGGTSGHPGVVLLWVDDPEAFVRQHSSYEGATLSITTNATVAREPGSEEFPRVRVQGHLGELVWVGDPGIGGVTVNWREYPGRCGSYSVGFPMTRWLLAHVDGEVPVGDRGDPQAVIEGELLRVVEALTRTGQE